MASVGDTHEENAICANCGAPLAGPYCHDCGQKAHLHHKLGHMLEEMVEGVTHLDGRLWATLPLLAFRPGRLSRQWKAGRRARYVSPLHVFLFAVFLLFLAPTITGRHMVDFGARGQGVVFQVDGGGHATPLNPATRQEIDAELSRAPAVARSLVHTFEKISKNPDYYGYKIESLAYKLSIFTVPISLFILALLMAGKRGFTLYDHAVVSLYGLGVLVLMLALASYLPRGIGGPVGYLILVAAPVHAALHLHGAYGLSWFGAIARTAALIALTAVGFGLFLFGVVMLGLAG